MFVEKAFVITLPFRSDRMENFRAATRGLQSIPEVVEWPAVHGDTCQPPEIWHAGAGAWGCYKSHVNILEYCLNNNVSSYVVFEDDAKFRPNFDTMFNKFSEALPEDWQQAYIGGQLLHTHSHPTIKINEGVYRPHNVNRTHGYMISRGGMLPVYQWLSNLPFVPQEHIDHHLGRWHEDTRNKVYAPPQWLIGQMGDSSNVSGKVEPVEYFTDPIETSLKHWLYDNPVCVIYRGSRETLQKSRAYLHAGNSLDANGYDVGLSLAAKFADPVPEIERWFSWIRSEIVRSNSRAVPCLFHPRITEKMLANCSFKTVILDAATADAVKHFHSSLLSQHYSAPHSLRNS